MSAPAHEISRLVEDDGFVFVHEYAMSQMPADCLGQNGLLQVLPFADEFFDRMPVTNPGNVLCDNRALVKVRRDIVGSCTDDLDASSVSLVVGVASCKRRKEAMVNIYRRNTCFLEKARTQNLHVAGQDDQIDFELSKNVQLQFFCALFIVRGYFNLMKGDLQRFAEVVKD